MTNVVIFFYESLKIWLDNTRAFTLLTDKDLFIVSGFVFIWVKIKLQLKIELNLHNFCAPRSKFQRAQETSWSSSKSVFQNVRHKVPFNVTSIQSLVNGITTLLTFCTIGISEHMKQNPIWVSNTLCTPIYHHRSNPYLIYALISIRLMKLISQIPHWYLICINIINILYIH